MTRAPLHVHLARATGASRVAAAAAAPGMAWLAGVLLCVGLAGSPAHAATAAGVPLPRGARSQESGVYASSQGFRKTVAFYQRHFDRRGSTYDLVPVYAYRGVAIARFLSRDPRSTWRAVHVFRHQGRTFIHVVPRQPQTPLTTTAPPG